MCEKQEQLADYYDGLPKESPGSRWPKTSLACVQEGKRLTPQQLARLNELCRQHSGVFQAPGAVKAQVRARSAAACMHAMARAASMCTPQQQRLPGAVRLPQAVLVNSLSVVIYETR